MKSEKEYVLRGLIERAKRKDITVKMTQEEFDFLDEDNEKAAWKAGDNKAKFILWHEGERWAFRIVKIVE